MINQVYICPVCGYNKLSTLPYYNGVGQFEICNCCGFEFGYDDDNKGETFDSWRQKWIYIKKGEWFSKNSKPKTWNMELLLKQLKNIQNSQYFEIQVKTKYGNKKLKFTLEEYINEISDSL